MPKRRGRNPIFLVLRGLQQFARLRRRLLGKTTPHWFKDGSALVSHVNIVGLAPTLLARAFVPRHFFDRLPAYFTSKYTWVKTPLKFLTSATSALAILYLLTVPAEIVEATGLKAEDVAKFFLVIALLSPLLAPLVCGFLYLLLRVFSIMPQVKVDRSLRAQFLIPLSPLSYCHLRLKRFFWSIFYYGVYFCIALYALVLALDFGMWLVAQAPPPDPNGSTAATGVFTSLAFLFVAMVGYLLLIVPYIEVLRAAVLFQSPGMHRVDAYLVQEVIAHLVSPVLAKPGRTRRILTNKLVAVTDALDGSIRQQERRMTTASTDKHASASAKRRKIYAKIIQVEELAQRLEELADGSPDHAKLLEQITRLRAMIAVSASVSLVGTAVAEPGLSVSSQTPRSDVPMAPSFDI